MTASTTHGEEPATAVPLALVKSHDISIVVPFEHDLKLNECDPIGLLSVAFGFVNFVY
jgi:hypothetical protein